MLGGPLPAKPVLVTFDDGYRDVLSKALPVLKPSTAGHGIRDHRPDLERRHKLPDLGTAEGLERNGIEIGSHTVDHLELPGLSDAAARRQLVLSRRALERHLGHPVQWFAYPAGGSTRGPLARQERRLRARGDDAARCDAGRAPPLELHRFEMLDSTGVRGLASLLGS